MLPALLLAAACAGWHADAVGTYEGTVESRGPKAIDTTIEDGPTGLSGSYLLHEPTRDVAGTLEPLGDEGCDVALFRWTDVYGTGVARLHFSPGYHCFEGAWGAEQTDPALTWRSCTRNRVTS